MRSKKEEEAKVPKEVEDIVEHLIRLSKEEGIEIKNYERLRKELIKIHLKAWEEKERKGKNDN